MSCLRDAQELQNEEFGNDLQNVIPELSSIKSVSR